MPEPISNRADRMEESGPPMRTTSAPTVPAPAPKGGQPSVLPEHATQQLPPALAQVERYIRERRDTDKPLIGWGVYFFLLGPLTLGIYYIVVYYQRLQRADMFRERRQHYYGAVADFTTQYAEQTRQLDAVHHDTDDLRAYVKERFLNVHKPVNAGLSVALSFLTLGVYWFIAVYKVMKFWWEIQVTEQDFCERASVIWSRLGIIRYPISFDPMQQLRRSFWTDFLLSVVTIGIYGIFWDYQLHTDPDKVYPEFHSTEDAVLSAARTAEGEQSPGRRAGSGD